MNKEQKIIELNSGETVELLKIQNLTIENVWFSEDSVSMDVSFGNNGLRGAGLTCSSDIFWDLLTTIEEKKNENVVDVILSELTGVRKGVERPPYLVDLEYLFGEPLAIDGITLIIYAVDEDCYFIYNYEK